MPLDLLTRSGDGVTVTLLYNRDDGQAFVRVIDPAGTHTIPGFTADPFDAFHHPYTYLDHDPFQRVNPDADPMED